MKLDDSILDQKVFRTFCQWKPDRTYGDCITLMDIYQRKYLLNETASTIWRLIDQDRTSREVLELAKQELELPLEDTNQFQVMALEFLSQMHDRGLLTSDNDVSIW